MVGNDWVALKVWKVRQGGVWGGMSEAPGRRGVQGVRAEAQFHVLVSAAPSRATQCSRDAPFYLLLRSALCPEPLGSTAPALRVPRPRPHPLEA